jgi:ribosome biogenesis GTPase A
MIATRRHIFCLARSSHIYRRNVSVSRNFSVARVPPPLPPDNVDEIEERWVLQPSKLNPRAAMGEEVWSSKRFSDQDISEMNRRLSEDNRRKSFSHSPNPKQPVTPLASIRGFLELNPHVCSGCGTQFQSKNPGAPGYLTKDKFADHILKAEKIKQQQDALKLLDMVSINVESDLAYNVLKEGNIPDDVIDGVIDMGRKINAQIPKNIFDGDSVARHKDKPMPSGVTKPQDTTSHASDTTNTSCEAGVAASTKIQEEVLGYDPVTMEPIYDVEELRKSFLSESFDPKEKYAKFHKKSKSTTPSDEAISAVDTEGSDSAAAIPVCQRCFRMQVYGECDDTLRPGWSEHELLTPARFQHLLGGIKDSKSVVLCLVDLFDVEGSIVNNLKDIAGKNPIIIVANKVDLLPKDVSLNRISDWVHSTVKRRCDLLSPRETDEFDMKLYTEKGWYPSRKNSEAGVLKRGNVHLVSCDTGYGLKELMSSVVGIAKDHGDKVYVMGTANVGKSSFINRLLRFSKKQKGSSMGSRKKMVVPQATVSRVPGTTLDFLKIKLPNGITVIDTPGLINPGQLTTKLNNAELKKVIPTKRVNHVSLRLEEGRCVLIGGLAKVELVEV